MVVMKRADDRVPALAVRPHNPGLCCDDVVNKSRHVLNETRLTYDLNVVRNPEVVSFV